MVQRGLSSFRQFLTRFSTSDWFLAMLKISTEHGSVVPVGSCVSETVNNIENVKRKVVLVIYRNSHASRALKFFLRSGNNPVVLKNSTEHVETLFIAFLDQLRLF